MSDLKSLISGLDWDLIGSQLNTHGYSDPVGMLTEQQCQTLRELFEREEGYRKTVIMERYRFGLGAYKYFSYPLPSIIQQLRSEIYPKLVPVANKWMTQLGLDQSYPDQLDEFSTNCHNSGQMKPTPLILKYGADGFNTLHQDLYGEVYFPIQAVIMLSEPEQDYQGGEFVLTRQIPRAQSEAVVLKPRLGEMVLFTTSFYPAKGKRGYYRVNVKHGVSKVREGTRFATGIIFHDALS